MSDDAGKATFMSKLTRTRLPLWVSLALLALLLLVFAWQRSAANRAEALLEQGRTAMAAQFQKERTALFAELRTRFNAENDEARRQFGLALAWAVRGEMIRSNLDQVDQFFTEIVKLPNTERVLLAGADGKVLVSTDRRHLGIDASTLVGADTLALAETEVRREDGVQLLVVPIMGLNTRMGTVIVTNRPADTLAGL